MKTGEKRSFEKDQNGLGRQSQFTLTFFEGQDWHLCKISAWLDQRSKWLKMVRILVFKKWKNTVRSLEWLSMLKTYFLNGHLFTKYRG